MTQTSTGRGHADLTLRDAVPHDLSAALDLTLASYREYAASFPAEFWQSYSANIEATLRDRGGAQHIVATQDGALQGSVLFYPPHTKPPQPDRFWTGWPEIRLLAVAPSMRGRGVARALMQECLCRARGWDAPYLQLHTMEVMQIARGMYERMGFVRMAELDFQTRDGIDVLGYSLDLRGNSSG